VLDKFCEETKRGCSATMSPSEDVRRSGSLTLVHCAAVSAFTSGRANKPEALSSSRGRLRAWRNPKIFPDQNTLGTMNFSFLP